MVLDKAEIRRRYRERKKQKTMYGERYMKKERETKRKYYVPVTELSEQEIRKRRRKTLARLRHV